MKNNLNKKEERKYPWAEEFRPKELQDLVGQNELLSKNSFLYKAINDDDIPSMILWGPPGSGKTSLANVIANLTQKKFVRFSAATEGIPRIRKIIKTAKQYLKINQETILFMDEIHRFNKKQQDILLPYVESGTITLIGATTENPSFEVNSALLSRTRVFVLNKLSRESILKILKKVAKNKNLEVNDKILKLISKLSNHDARRAINTLELASKNKKITEKLIIDIFQRNYLNYDKNGEEHYNIISALHKSMRGGDANASLYWLSRMIEGGEDPLYIARRLIRFASEDIGIVNNSALLLAVSVYDACHYLGWPECDVNLAHCVVYLAKSKKNVNVYKGIKKAKRDVYEYGNLEVPFHIRNSPTKLMKNLGWGKNYKYSPDHDWKESQTYLPEKLKGRRYL